MKVLLPFVCMLVWVFAAAPSGARGETFTVFAAASLSDALNDAIKTYQARTQDTVRASGTRRAPHSARQIENGAPADVFISADLEWMDYLQKKSRTACQSLRPRAQRTRADCACRLDNQARHHSRVPARGCARKRPAGSGRSLAASRRVVMRRAHWRRWASGRASSTASRRRAMFARRSCWWPGVKHRSASFTAPTRPSSGG